MALLVLAFFGSKFVLELILGRSWCGPYRRWPGSRWEPPSRFT